jgi:Flp pilus assembly protein TadD
LAVAYLRLDLTDKAISELKKSIELSESDPAIHYNLGFLYDSSGMRERQQKSING